MKQPAIQQVSVACPCGITHRVEVAHYDRIIVSCNRPYWTLQPKRNGQFKLFPWPGQNLTRAEMAEKEAAEL